MFITSLERAGVRPKMAQTLARHSDVRLTLGTYTHVEIYDQTAAVESLTRSSVIPVWLLAISRGVEWGSPVRSDRSRW